VNALSRFFSVFRRHFHGQEATDNTASRVDDGSDYDDRQSVFPFVKEEPGLESPTHEREAQQHEADTAYQRELVSWTRRLAYTTGALALATFIVACFSGWQGSEMRQGSADTARLANSAEGLLVATQRPWIAFEALITEPLKYNVNGANIGMTFVMENVGHTPAVHVWPSYMAFTQSLMRNAMSEQRRLCAQARDQPFADEEPGFVIFPGRTISGSFSTNISSDEINEANSITHDDMMSPMIVGCVSYQFSFGEKKRHQTGFIYQLNRSKPGVPGTFIFFRKDGDIPVEQLRLTPFFVSGGGFKAD
jgi:hypothetical protein